MAELTQAEAAAAPARANELRRVAFTMTLAMLTLAPLLFQTWLSIRMVSYGADFRAFYCAAKVASEGHNPYHIEPLRTCEVAAGPSLFFAENRNVTVPAPLPGYTIAVLMPLTLLPFVPATIVWTALLIASWMVCVGATLRFCRISLSAACAMFAFSIGLCSIPFGETVPIAVAAICCAAALAHAGNWRAAGIAAAIAMLEPHLGLPVCIAFVLYAPRSRLTLVSIGVVFAVVSLIAIGPAANFEYFAKILPAHALSEVARDTQYSLTSILASVGVNAAIAVQAGTLWYLLMVVAGCFLAGRAAALTGNAAFLACIPVAMAVFGGTFIHITQIAAALPVAALIATTSIAAGRRNIASVALLLLAVPWIGPLTPIFALAPLFPVAYIAWDLRRNFRFAGYSAIVAFVLIACLSEAGGIAAKQHNAVYAGGYIDADLAEASWSEFTKQSSATNSVAAWAGRVPTWAGLMLLIYAIAGESQLTALMRGSPKRMIERYH